jgi:O-antigen/teichoic acid export membrane protein
MRLLYGEGFIQGAEALQVLALTLPINFASAILINGLVATTKRRALAIGAAVAAVMNVGLNVLLIPSIGMRGAAMATIASEGALLATGIIGCKVAGRAPGTVLSLMWVILASAAVALMLPLTGLPQGTTLGVVSLVIYGLIVIPIPSLRRLPFRDSGRTQ